MPHRTSHYLQYAAIRGVFAILRWLPRRGRAAIGVGLGRIAFLLGIRRRVMAANLLQAFPTLPPQGVRTMTRRCLEHFGTVATNLEAPLRMTADEVRDWVLFEGLENMDNAVRGGQGGIVVSGHLGNWEVIGAACARLGYPVSFVVTTQRNKLVEAWLDNLRRDAGVEIIPRKQAIKGVLNALKRNRIVAILIDQDAHEDGVFVPFFGRLSSTPRGPAVFHLRTGAPLIFMQSYRLEGEFYRGRLTHVNVPENATQESIMADLTARLEQAVRQAPEQWFWMHRRWKTTPPEFS
ncbi:MAG: lysophospholipid acyltransferase family protein [bacterium]|nr:lysophospholipid acyltransferase family protein [bacterium]